MSEENQSEEVETETPLPKGTPEGDPTIERHTDMTGDPDIEDLISGLSGPTDESFDATEELPQSRETVVEELDKAEEVAEKVEEEPEPVKEDAEEEPAEKESTPDVEEEKPEVVPEEAAAPEVTAEEQSTVETLRARLNELSAQLLAKSEAGEVDEKPAVEVTLENETFVSEKDEQGFQDLLATPRALNEMFNTIYQKSVAKAREISLTEVPGAVRPMLRKELEERERSAAFYTDHPDLRSERDSVALIARHMIEEKEQAGKPYTTQDDLFAELAPEARRRLSLPDPGAPGPSTTSTNVVRTKAEKPAFASAGGTRKPSLPKMSAMERDVLEMIDGG